MQSQKTLRHSNEGRRPAFSRRRRRSEAGFIQTLEFLVLLAIFGTVFYFALEMVKGWLIQSIDPMGGKNVVVYDHPAFGDARLMARTTSFVNNEAPVMIYRVDTNEAAVLGLRAEPIGGYTTGQRVYFPTADCSGDVAYLLDPTTDAGNAVQFLEWTAPFDPTPGDVGYGHPISDFYTLQTVAFAMGPPIMPGGYPTLWRAKGSLAYDPPQGPGIDAFVTGYPASEWDSTRYDAARCRTVGPVTNVGPNAEQTILATWLMYADNWYNVSDKFGTPFESNFWSPTQVSEIAPPVAMDTGGPGFYTSTGEGDPTQGVSAVTFTDADGIVHTVPGGEGTP